MRISKRLLKKIVAEELKESRFSNQKMMRARAASDSWDDQAPVVEPQAKAPLKKFGGPEFDFEDEGDSGLELAREGEMEDDEDSYQECRGIVEELMNIYGTQNVLYAAQSLKKEKDAEELEEI